MKKIYFLLSLILISCRATTPVSQSIPELSVIKYQAPNITKEDVVTKEGLDLVVGIYGISNDVVFLYGGMSAYDGEYKSMQSTLLLSTNGGISWKEVMKPVSDSYIKGFAMLASGVGWALMYKPLAQNQPYQYSLYKTIDHGASWEDVSVIPLSADIFPLALQMIFVDELHGQIDMLYDGGFGYLEFLTTNDGGKNWKQSGTYKPDFDGNVPTLSILESYHSLIRDNSKSFSLDHSSYWNLKGEYGNPDVDVIVIQRQTYNNDGAEDIQKVVLPKHFEYVNGQIISP